MNERVPESLKQVFGLYCLNISNCKRFQIESFDAHGCTSLESVPRSALTEKLERYQVRNHYEELISSYCLKLDQKTWSNIMNDAKLRIPRIATASLMLKDDNYVCLSLCFSLRSSIPLLSLTDQLVFLHDKLIMMFVTMWQESRQTPSASIFCQGNKIPKWFNHQTEGSSIHIKLPPHWFDTNLLGFVVCIAVAFCNYMGNWELDFRCESHFKPNSSESHVSNCHLYGWGSG